MTLRRTNIPYSQFLAAAASCSRALSRTARPLVDEMAYTYGCSFAEFITGNVYPVWFVNAERTCFLNYDDPRAQPILISELASLAQLVKSRLSSWYKPELGPIKEASFVTLYCTGCNRRILIDGVHRALWLLVYGVQNIPVHVTELSGKQWPAGTPDLNIICTCDSPK